MMATAKSYYEILEVEETATEVEIKNSYRFLSQAYHPDKFGTVQHKEKAEAKFKQINEAYQVLSVDEKRRRYDALNGIRKKENYLADKVEIDLVVLKGRCVLMREQKKVVMVLIQSFTTSVFSLYWKAEEDETTSIGTPVKKEFRIESGNTAAVKFSAPKDKGVLNIYDHVSKNLERVPL